MVLRGIPLWSDALGLSGRADAVEVHDDGAVRPVEYKAGTRHGSAADLQLCAQAMCLEEMLAVRIPFGYVWYGGPRRRTKVPVTATLRGEVERITEEIRAQLLTAVLPTAVADARCDECQLLHHCLPRLSKAKRPVRRYISDVVFRCAT